MPGTRRKTRAARLPTIIGWREHIGLPDLGLVAVSAKIDTGARTTALHASRIRTYERDGELWVEFHPEHERLEASRLCWMPVHDRRSITNTSGVPEERVIIRTRLLIATHALHVDVSLSDRTDMSYPIIIGRSALRRARLLVDSGRSWLTEPREGD